MPVVQPVQVRPFCHWAVAVLLVVGAFFFQGQWVAADDPPAAGKAGELQKELTDVRAALAEARENLTKQTKDLWQQQHDAEYNDPDCSRLRQEINALEKQVMDKRRELAAHLATLKTVKDLEAQRVELFRNVQELESRERLILNEIQALGSPGGPQS